MVDTKKQRAARHSITAFSLLTAARSQRRAAADLRIAGASDLADAARKLAAKADRRRRTVESKKP